MVIFAVYIYIRILLGNKRFSGYGCYVHTQYALLLCVCARALVSSCRWKFSPLSSWSLASLSISLVCPCVCALHNNLLLNRKTIEPLLTSSKLASAQLHAASYFSVFPAHSWNSLYGHLRHLLGGWMVFITNLNYMQYGVWHDAVGISVIKFGAHRFLRWEWRMETVPRRFIDKVKWTHTSQCCWRIEMLMIDMNLNEIFT